VTGVVAGSAADEAGLVMGDIIRSVDGEVVRTPEQLRSAVAAKQPGDEVTITYERSNREYRVDVELGEASAVAPNATTPTPEATRPPRDTQSALDRLPPEIRERLQRDLDAGRLSPQEMQQFLRLYQARGDNVRVGEVVSVNPGTVSGFILTLEPNIGGNNVTVELNEKTTLMRGGTLIQPGDLKEEELVLVISMDGGQTAFAVLAFGVLPD
jgi:membrane-associated protease RseP (regulator of RpoE activity)